MSKRKKTILTVIAVAAAIVIAASVAFRIILTRDRLVSLLVPRIEKAVDASIRVGDIGVRFPFGFGVEARDIFFEKKLAETGDLEFRSDRMVLKVSILSLIRRRPEIEKFDLEGASAAFIDSKKGTRIDLSGVGARLEMNPSDSAYDIRADVRIPETVFTPKDGAPVKIENLSIESRLTGSLDFSRLSTGRTVISYMDMISATVSGEVRDIKGKRDIAAKVEIGRTDTAPVISRLLKIVEGRRSPAPGMEEAPGKFPAEVASGSFTLKADISGSALEPSAIAVDGILGLSDIVLIAEKARVPVEVEGEIAFSRKAAKSESILISSGPSSLAVRFGVSMDEAGKPSELDFAGKLDADLENIAGKALSGSAPASGFRLGGKIRGAIEGGGSVAAMKDLFPAAGGEEPEKAAYRAWKDVDLKGTFDFSGVFFSTEGGPASVADLSGRVDLSGGNAALSSAKFRLNGSPWELSADLPGIISALAGMLPALKGGKRPADLVSALAMVDTPPDIHIRIKGRSFDARPLQEAARRKKSGEAGSPGESEKGMSAGSSGLQALAANPITLFTLKRSGFEAGLDSLITDKAVFTAIAATGTVRDAVVKAPAFTAEYAGGKGNGTAEVDLRDPSGIKSRFDLSFDGIEAGRALGGLHEMGRLLSGTFSFRAAGDIMTGEGINPLLTLGAEGNATSAGGKIDLSRFISPVSSLAGIDMSGLEKIDFDTWTGSYRIQKGRLETSDWKISSRAGDWNVAGSFGFDGTLSYRARLFMTPDEQKRIRELDKYRDIVDLFRDDKGNLILDLDIGGTAESPKIRLDQSGAKKKAQEKITDGLRQKAGDALKELLKKKGE